MSSSLRGSLHSASSMDFLLANVKLKKSLQILELSSVTSQKVGQD